MPQEIELKLIIDPELSADAESIFENLVGLQSKRTTQLANTYFDTPSRAVHRAKSTLRVRRDGDRWIQTLKRSALQSAGGLSKRGEWEWDLPSNHLDLLSLANYLVAQIPLRVGALSKAGRAARLLSHSLEPDQQQGASEILIPPSNSLADALIHWERSFECVCRDLCADLLRDARWSLTIG